MFGKQSDSPTPKVGTTSLIFIPKAGSTGLVKPGEYFWIKIHSSQAAFRGSIFEQVKQLVVTSVVNLNHPLLGNEDIRAIQRTREVKKDAAVQLGLSSNLISLVPATMTHVSVSIDFILDKENNLAKLGALVNDDSFLAAISLAPGVAAVAKTVSGLAQKVIQTFIPAEERKPILQFSGDFNLSADADAKALRDGYYAILGSQDVRNPLPQATTNLVIDNSGLLLDGQPVPHLSYVVLEVGRSPERTRDLSEGAAWDAKLREAESIAQETADDPFADDSEKRDIWKKCVAVLLEARALLLTDPGYSPAEAQAIYKTVYKRCADLISGRGEAGLAAAKGASDHRGFESRSKPTGHRARGRSQQDRRGVPAARGGCYPLAEVKRLAARRVVK